MTTGVAVGVGVTTGVAVGVGVTTGAGVSLSSGERPEQMGIVVVEYLYAGFASLDTLTVTSAHIPQCEKVAITLPVESIITLTSGLSEYLPPKLALARQIKLGSKLLI